MLDVDSATAAAIAESARAISEACASKYSGDAAVIVDKVIRAANRGEARSDDVAVALEHLANWLAEVRERNDFAFWEAACLVYRMRCALVLSKRIEDVGALDRMLAEQERLTGESHQKRWLGEVRSTQCVPVEGSGVRVITDPHDPALKGNPPQ